MKKQEKWVIFNMNGYSRLWKNGKMMKAFYGKLLSNIISYLGRLPMILLTSQITICLYSWRME
jgi:hypothetical protein